MVDLTAEMAGLWSALGPSPKGRGRVVMFCSGHRGDGVSTIAREFSRLAAVRADKPVWLIDADLGNQQQCDEISSQPHRFGRAGQRVAGSPDGACFFTTKSPLISSAGRPIRPAVLLTAIPFLGKRLYVSHIQTSALAVGQQLQIVEHSAYWAALSRYAGTVVVDVPAGDRSSVAELLAPYMDAVVMVVAEGRDVNLSLAFQARLEMQDAPIKGIVLNRSTFKSPWFLNRLMA